MTGSGGGGKHGPSSRQRREFIRSAIFLGGTCSLSLAGLLPLAIDSGDSQLRPPGALDENEFLAACIKCGQCVQVCPVEAIGLDGTLAGVGQGVPLLNARQQACDFSCDGLQCVLACPTGALSHDLNYPHEVKMGVAEMVAKERCLAFRGKGFSGVIRAAEIKAGEFAGKLRYSEVDRWNPIPVVDHPYDLPLCDLCVRLCPIEIRRTECERGKPPSGDPNQCPPQAAIALEIVNSDDGVPKALPVVKDGCVGCGVCEMVCPVSGTAIAVVPATGGDLVG